jgi:hypothetical protein
MTPLTPNPNPPRPGEARVVCLLRGCGCCSAKGFERPNSRPLTPAPHPHTTQAQPTDGRRPSSDRRQASRAQATTKEGFRNQEDRESKSNGRKRKAKAKAGADSGRLMDRRACGVRGGREKKKCGVHDRRSVPTVPCLCRELPRLDPSTPTLPDQRL